MKAGDLFYFFDGKKEWQAQIIEIQKREVNANVLEEIKNDREPELKVKLYQAIPKKPALFELILQKATEIGVSEIYPLITERTENRKLHKFDRMENILIEATEQCRGIKVPLLHHPITLEEAVKNEKNSFLAYEYEEKNAFKKHQTAIGKMKELGVFIGPEGGWSQQEIDFCTKKGVKTFGMGKRILRTETAAISALSLILLQ